MEITPKIFASWIDKTFGAREASWNGTRYTIDWFDAALSVGVPREWAYPVQMMLFDGYADTEEWLKEYA